MGKFDWRIWQQLSFLVLSLACFGLIRQQNSTGGWNLHLFFAIFLILPAAVLLTMFWMNAGPQTSLLGRCLWTFTLFLVEGPLLYAVIHTALTPFPTVVSAVFGPSDDDAVAEHWQWFPSIAGWANTPDRPYIQTRIWVPFGATYRKEHGRLVWVRTRIPITVMGKRWRGTVTFGPGGDFLAGELVDNTELSYGIPCKAGTVAVLRRGGWLQQGVLMRSTVMQGMLLPAGTKFERSEFETSSGTTVYTVSAKRRPFRAGGFAIPPDTAYVMEINNNSTRSLEGITPVNGQSVRSRAEAIDMSGVKLTKVSVRDRQTWGILFEDSKIDGVLRKAGEEVSLGAVRVYP